MRKLALSMMLTVNGYTEGRNNDLDWHVWDEEMSEYMMNYFATVDTFLYGRKSYELMLSYWPGMQGEFADIMNTTPKLVFSRTLDTVQWNAELIKDNAPAEVERRKHLPGKDMVLFAGANLAAGLMAHKLIDEYRFIINPRVLGSGTPLFGELSDRLDLQLLETRAFNCGNVLLVYKNHEE